MLIRWFWSTLGRTFRNHRGIGNRVSRHRRNRIVARVERFEDRILLASTITVTSGAIGTGSLDGFVSATDGIITTADGGNVAGTLSTGALANIGAGVNIDVAATTSVTFNDVGTLALKTGVGKGVTFQTAGASAGVITFTNTANTLSTAGGSITLTAGTNLTAANLNTNGASVVLTAGAAAAGNLSIQGILTGGTGNMALHATNAAGGTITQSGVASGLAISATATGSITADALHGTTVGLQSNVGSVNSFGSNPVQASTQLTLSAATGINVNMLTPKLQASNSTSGNITVTQAASPAQPLTIVGTGVTSNVAGGQIFITNLGSVITVNGGVGIQSNAGSVNLGAKDFSLSGTINSGAAATSIQNSIAGLQFDLGTNTPGKIGLTQSELNNITAGVLRIGNPSAGAITVSSAIAAPAGWNTLTQINNGTIVEAAAGSLVVPNLRVISTGQVTLTNANAVGTLAADVTSSFAFNNGTSSLSVGIVDGETGITASNSAVSLIADNLNLQQSVNAGTGSVTLSPFSDTNSINLGGFNAVGTFGLTDNELGQITGKVLRVGTSANTGGITISSAITRHAGFNTLDLISVGAWSQSAPLSVANLVLQTNVGVSLTNAGNDVDTLAASLYSLTYTDANSFSIGVVDNVTGISAFGLNALVSLTAANGAITNSAPAAVVDVTSSSLALSASTGIGSLAKVFTTAVNGLVAQTLTGGIFVTNTGSLAIGFSSDPFQGVRVASSGGIQLMAMGSVNVTDNAAANEIISAPSNVSVNATGATSDLTTGENLNNFGNATNALRGSIVSTIGTVSLMAGRDLFVGNPAAAGLYGNVLAGSSLTLNAGRDINVDSFSYAYASAFSTNTAATLTATAGRNISLLQSNASAGSACFTHGGAMTLKTGATGIFTAGSGTAAGDLQSQGGSITVSANDIVINDPIVAGAGIVTLQQAGTTARNVTIGSGGSGLGLGNAEIGQLKASVVRIGRSDNTGNITVDGNVTSHAGFSSLDLRSGGSITQSNGAITVSNLAAKAGGSVVLLTTACSVGTLAGSAGSVFEIANTSNLTIGTVDGTAGISDTAGAGDVTLTVNGAGHVLVVSQPITTGGSIAVLTADNMALNAAVNVKTTGIVILTPFTVSEAMDLGTNSTGHLGLTDTELDKITASTVQLGSALPQFAGNVIVTAPITQSGSGYANLQINTTGAVSDNGGSIAGTNLDIFSGTGIGTTATPLTTLVSNLDFNNSKSGVVDISNTGNLTITNVAGAGNAVSSGGSITLISSGALTFTVNTSSSLAIIGTATGPLTVAANLVCPSTLTLTASESTAATGGDNLTVNSGATIHSMGGHIALRAGDNLTLQSGSTVQADASSVGLAGEFNNNDNLPTTITINGTIINSVTSTATGGTQGDTFVVNAKGAGTLQLDGEGGSDNYSVNLGSITGTVAIVDSGTNGTDTATINGTSANDTLTVTSTSTTVGSQTVTYTSTLEDLTLNGGSGNDTFNVTPSSTLVITVNGGSPTPPASPGDVLNINSAGTTNLSHTSTSTANGLQGSFTFGNRKNVNFSQLESFTP